MHLLRRRGGAGRGNDPGYRGAFPWDAARWEPGLRDTVRALLHLRSAEPGLRDGPLGVVGAAGAAVAFERGSGAARFIVAVNPAMAGSARLRLATPLAVPAGISRRSTARAGRDPRDRASWTAGRRSNCPPAAGRSCGWCEPHPRYTPGPMAELPVDSMMASAIAWPPSSTSRARSHALSMHSARLRSDVLLLDGVDGFRLGNCASWAAASSARTAPTARPASTRERIRGRRHQSLVVIPRRGP